MKMFSNQYNIIFFMLFSLILFILIFKWIEYLTNNKYIIECFTGGANNEKSDGSTSHNVDLPLTTTQSCTNFCGPNARCSITGQQCFADIDCPGCQPSKPTSTSSSSKNETDCVPANNDAGKLTVGVTPTYSSLTSGYGTREKIITSNMYSKPDMPNFGVNTWLDAYNEEKILFDKRYKPPNIEFTPNYSEKYTLTGQFIDDGPYASNAPMN
jgi:hypothetical protein